MGYLKIYLITGELTCLECDTAARSHAKVTGRSVGTGAAGSAGAASGPAARPDGDDMLRAGRMLAQGDLRLIVLALIAEQPRHGYEIIKLIEEKTSDWYSPSPGIVYPTLTYLEDLGYLTAQAEGAKKLYTITDEGRAHLDAEPRSHRRHPRAPRRHRRAGRALARPRA